jgi:hypothetical protein
VPTRHEWGALPRHVRDAVEAHIGPVSGATAIGSGYNSDVVTRLDRDGRSSVFLKGVHGRSHHMRFLRNEITGNGLAPGIAPAVLFHEDLADEWLVVGFEYLTGRHPTFAPGSADLDAVSATLEAISALPGPDLHPLRER